MFLIDLNTIVKETGVLLKNEDFINLSSPVGWASRLAGTTETATLLRFGLAHVLIPALVQVLA
jgi:hypothetical protein